MIPGCFPEAPQQYVQMLLYFPAGKRISHPSSVWGLGSINPQVTRFQVARVDSGYEAEAMLVSLCHFYQH